MQEGPVQVPSDAGMVMGCLKADRCLSLRRAVLPVPSRLMPFRNVPVVARVSRMLLAGRVYRMGRHALPLARGQVLVPVAKNQPLLQICGAERGEGSRLAVTR